MSPGAPRRAAAGVARAREPEGALRQQLAGIDLAGLEWPLAFEGITGFGGLGRRFGPGAAAVLECHAGDAQLPTRLRGSRADR